MSEETQDLRMGIIEPELVAKKIADVRRLMCPTLAQYCSEKPRAIEALWSIQFFSMQPGGMGKFTEDFLTYLEPKIGTETARRLGHRKYTRAECLAVLEEVKGYIPQSRHEHYGYGFEDEDEREKLRQKEDNEYREMVEAAVRGNEPFFRARANAAAKREVREWLESLCVGNGEQVSRWWCADILAEVLAFVDERAQIVRQRLAPTVVSEKIFDAIDYAVTEGVMVRIEGNSRFGKTESLEAYANMYPGRLRVTRTPPSTSVRDLIRAVAEAFGIHQTFGTRGEALKDKVEFVLRFSGLICAFDEGAHLVPTAYTANTAPDRLNWIRHAIVDRKLPCVIVVTPQNYNAAIAKFVAKTESSIEQFLGREALRIPLPDELSQEDLFAVARIHFPEASDDLITLIVAKALQSESYLKAVEHIAKRARYIAKKRNAKKLSLADVETAISEVMPQSVAVPAHSPAPAPRAARKQIRRSGAATVLQAQFRDAAVTQFPARKTTPLDTSHEADTALATG